MNVSIEEKKIKIRKYFPLVYIPLNFLCETTYIMKVSQNV